MITPHRALRVTALLLTLGHYGNFPASTAPDVSSGRLLRRGSRVEEARILFKKAAELLGSHQQEHRDIATTPPKN